MYLNLPDDVILQLWGKALVTNPHLHDNCPKPSFCRYAPTSSSWGHPLHSRFKSTAWSHGTASRPDPLFMHSRNTAIFPNMEWIVQYYRKDVVYRGIHTGQDLAQIFQTGPGTIDITANSVRASFLDRDTSNPPATPGSLVRVLVRAGTLTRSLFQNTTLTDSATMSTKTVDGTGVLNTRSVGSVRTTGTGIIQKNEYRGTAIVSHTASQRLRQQLRTTTKPLSSTTLLERARYEETSTDCASHSKVTGGGPAHHFDLGDQSVYLNTKTSCSGQNIGDGMLIQRVLSGSATCTINDTTVTSNALVGADPQAPSTVAQVTATDSSSYDYRSTLCTKNVEMGTLADKRFYGKSVCTTLINNCTRRQGSPSMISPLAAVVEMVADSATATNRFSANTTQLYCSAAEGAIQLLAMGNAKRVDTASSDTSSVQGGAGLVTTTASSTANSACTVTNPQWSVLADAAALRVTSGDTANLLATVQGGTLSAVQAIVSTNTGNASQKAGWTQGILTPRTAGTAPPSGGGVWLTGINSSTGAYALDGSFTSFILNNSFVVQAIQYDGTGASGTANINASNANIVEEPVASTDAVTPAIARALAVRITAGGVGTGFTASSSSLEGAATTTRVKLNGVSIELFSPEGTAVVMNVRDKTTSTLEVANANILASQAFSTTLTGAASLIRNISNLSARTPANIPASSTPVDQVVASDTSTMTSTLANNTWNGGIEVGVALRDVLVSDNAKHIMSSNGETMVQTLMGDGIAETTTGTGSVATTLSTLMVTTPTGVALSQNHTLSSTNQTLTVNGATLMGQRAVRHLVGAAISNVTVSSVTATGSGMPAPNGSRTNFIEFDNSHNVMAGGKLTVLITNAGVNSDPNHNLHTVRAVGEPPLR